MMASPSSPPSAAFALLGVCPSGNPECRRRSLCSSLLLLSSSTDATNASSFSRSLSSSHHHHHPLPSASVPSGMSVSPFVRLPPALFPAFYADQPASGQHSRGESHLELEALSAVHQFAIAVQSIAVSEMLPRTPDLIFVNLTTLEGQPYCLELTSKGWRVTSLRSDCMQGDFTRMDLFTRYYRSLYELMDAISPEYRERFAERLSRRCIELANRTNRRTSAEAMDCLACSDCSAEEAEEPRGNSWSPCAFCRRTRSPPMAATEENGGGRHGMSGDCGDYGGSWRPSLLFAPSGADFAGSSSSEGCSRCSPSPPQQQKKEQKQTAH